MLASVGEIAEYASASAAIGRLWKNSRQLNKQILALNEFSQRNFFSSGRRFSSSNCSVIVYSKRFLPTSFCWHVYAQQSRTLKCVLATLLNISTSFCALIHRRTITMVYTIRGPAATQPMKVSWSAHTETSRTLRCSMEKRLLLQHCNWATKESTVTNLFLLHTSNLLFPI